MTTLEKLLGGQGRVRVMKLFLFNPEFKVQSDIIAEKTQIKGASLKREMKFLVDAGFLKKRGSGRKTNYYLNESFKFKNEFKDLLIQNAFTSHDVLLKKLSKIGRLKMVALSGMFTNLTDAKVDMLVVVDNARQPVINKVVSHIEAEMGRELKFAFIGADDFKYRIGVGDRLIRDVFDYPHNIIVDKIGVAMNRS